MLKKILVPIAFSSYSESILDYALNLARPHGAKLLIVNEFRRRNRYGMIRPSTVKYYQLCVNQTGVISREQ